MVYYPNSKGLPFAAQIKDRFFLDSGEWNRKIARKQINQKAPVLEIFWFARNKITAVRGKILDSSPGSE